jgi:hypothetical protein
MKLFKSLLVAPATIGLLAPLAANATEINLNDVTNYSDVDSIEFANSFENEKSSEGTLIAGGEGLGSHDGGFSETTTASFSADFAIGAVDGISGNEALTAGYSFQIDLNTSFTGEDSFDVSIDAGNADDGNLDELDLNDAGDGLVVDGIAYTFPIGDKATVFLGDSVDGSSLYNTACVYGGQTDTLDDCGAATSVLDEGAGSAAGASFDFGDGFTAALGYTGDGASTNGLLTKEGYDSLGGQLTYIGDSFGASVSYAAVEGAQDKSFWALNGYWTPEETGSVPSISVGYEFGDNKATKKDTTQYFVGLQWDEAGPGTVGVALGNTGPITDGDTETTMYEIFYTYPINDGMTITPIFYSKEVSGADNQTGVLVKTSFSF